MFSVQLSISGENSFLASVEAEIFVHSLIEKEVFLRGLEEKVQEPHNQSSGKRKVAVGTLMLSGRITSLI